MRGICGLIGRQCNVVLELKQDLVIRIAALWQWSFDLSEIDDERVSDDLIRFETNETDERGPISGESENRVSVE